ncbi:MAG TPA: hypothetical protein VEO01_37565, partial [Pseudonocardiaceae bacterium]|nr:hypothetical protein [Pseudonocardiaceae bacterium]
MVRGRDRQANNSNPRLRVVGDVDAGESGVAALRDQLVAVGVPVEVLEALDGAEDPAEIVGRLVEAGLLPSPVDAVDGLLEGWRPLLRRNTTPVDAELSCAARMTERSIQTHFLTSPARAARHGASWRCAAPVSS